MRKKRLIIRQFWSIWWEVYRISTFNCKGDVRKNFGPQPKNLVSERESFSGGLWKLHSSCLEENYGNKFFFEKIHKIFWSRSKNVRTIRKNLSTWRIFREESGDCLKTFECLRDSKGFLAAFPSKAIYQFSKRIFTKETIENWLDS